MSFSNRKRGRERERESEEMTEKSNVSSVIVFKRKTGFPATLNGVSTPAVSGTLIQVTSYPGARLPDAFTTVSFRFVPLPHDYFFAIVRVFESVSRVLIMTRRPLCFACLSVMIGYQRNRAHDNIQIEERNFDESLNDNVRITSRNVNCHLKLPYSMKRHFSQFKLNFWPSTLDLFC